MRKVTVFAYGFRHGKALTGAKGDKLLPEGVVQVIKSSINNLSGIEFHVLYASLRHRALQTAHLIALATMGKEDCHVNLEENFDYPDSLIEECGGGEFMNKAAKDLAADRGRSVITIQDWMDAVPKWTSFMREQVSQELCKVAKYEAFKRDLDVVNVLIANHSPVIDTAAVDMASTPRLTETDIIKYTIEVNLDGCDRSACIVASDYIHRGF